MIDWQRAWGFVLGVIACAIISLLAGCSTTRYVPVESVRTEYKDRIVAVHDTVTDAQLKHNDTYRHDSTAVSQHGDSVKIEHWHTTVIKIIENNSHGTSKTVADSSAAARVDSVKVPYPVERKLTKWEQVKMDTGGLSLGIAGIALIAGIVAIVRWLRIKIKRK